MRRPIPAAFLAIDCGTTNTRVWLLREGEVIARAEVQVGVRETARTGSPAMLKGGIDAAIEQAASRAGADIPDVGLAAGMITSRLGLVDLPHLPAPAGPDDLADAVERVDYPDHGGLSVYYVRGVRAGEVGCGLDGAPETDIIRGEETEVFGALQGLSLDSPLLYVHLGSHTKAIQIDAEGRIAGGITTLAGELDHVVRTETILSGALPPERMEPCDESLLDRGAEWARAYGLPRSFFLIRILDQSGQFEPHQLGNVFVGAIAGEDLHALRGHGLLDRYDRVVLSGRPRFQSAWRHFLERGGLDVTGLTEEQTEHAFLTGLRNIVFRSPDFA
ncbi:MAG: 2-dehydro-3-deoxygalactonokinase [Planctomycetota bacterium]